MRQMPAQSGLWASGACYPVEPQRHWRAARSTGEMPLTNLCNRPSCHEYPRSHAIPKLGALTLSPAAILLVLPPGWEPSLLLEAILGDAGLPLLASPALGRPRSWSAPPAATRPSPQQGCAVSRAAARVGVVDPPRARWSGPQTPRVATRSSCPASRAVPRGPGPASPHPNQRMRLFEPEAPSASKSHRRRPSSRSNGDRVGRHWYPGFAAVGPASDMLSRPYPRSARPKSLPAVRRGP